MKERKKSLRCKFHFFFGPPAVESVSTFSRWKDERKTRKKYIFPESIYFFSAPLQFLIWSDPDDFSISNNVISSSSSSSRQTPACNVTEPTQCEATAGETIYLGFAKCSVLAVQSTLPHFRKLIHWTPLNMATSGRNTFIIRSVNLAKKSFTKVATITGWTYNRWIY